MFWKPCSRSISSIFPCFSSIGWSSAFSSIGWSSTFSNKKQRKRTLLESLLSKFSWKFILSQSNSPSKGSPYPSTGPSRVSILGTILTFWITFFSVLAQIRYYYSAGVQNLTGISWGCSGTSTSCSRSSASCSGKNRQGSTSVTSLKNCNIPNVTTNTTYLAVLPPVLNIFPVSCMYTRGPANGDCDWREML